MLNRSVADVKCSPASLRLFAVTTISAAEPGKRSGFWSMNEDASALSEPTVAADVPAPASRSAAEETALASLPSGATGVSSAVAILSEAAPTLSPPLIWFSRS